MLAVFVNMLAVIIGSTIGILFRSRIKEKYINAVISALGLVTILIGVSSAIKTAELLCVIVCMAVGTALGELLRIDDRINSVGDKLKGRLFKSGGGGGMFTEGFVSACLLFCVGSMSIMGSFEAGINHDYSIIFAKSAMDFASAIMFSAAMGVGVACSAIFILLYQGALTLLAEFVSPYLGPDIVTEMSAVGGTILIGMGLNILDLSQKKIKVANMLPAIFLPIAYFPLTNWIGGLL